MIKRFILAAMLACLSFAAAAQVTLYPFFMREVQMDMIGNSMVPRLIPFPVAGVKCIRVLDGDRKMMGPSCYTMGSSFTVNAMGVINVPVTNGVDGAQGPAGPGGAMGPAGAQGSPGPAGTNATVTSASVLAALGYTPIAPTDPRLTDARAPLAHTHAISDVTGLQTSLDAKYSATNPAGYITAAAIAGKYNTPTGTTAQYVRGDGSLATLPASMAAPTINRVRATTAADGTYTWTYPTACSAQPVVSVTPENGVSGEVINHKVTAVTATSMSVSVSRAVLTLNGLLGLTLPVIQTPTAQVIHLIAVCPA